MKIDIIIAIAAILISLVSAVKKEKKKQAQTQKRASQPEPPHDKKSIFDFDVEEEESEYQKKDFWDGETFDTPKAENKEKVSKKEEYYTYETIESENDNLEIQNQNTTKKEPVTSIQNTEKEEEKNSLKEFDNDELRKAIIYSEILQRPHK